MSSDQESQFVTVKLSHPTIFPDLNKTEGKDENFARDTVNVMRLKFKHFRHLKNMSDENQMAELMLKLTGLSEDDVDELYAEDAAEITTVIFSFMEKYIQLAKKMSS
jgi:predicted lactoylglutathione lyase